MSAEKCPDCGRTLEDARRSGRLGCPGCWDSFRTELVQIVSGMHGSERHPPLPDARAQARDLRRSRMEGELQAALEREAYDEATLLRDRLREEFQ